MVDDQLEHLREQLANANQALGSFSHAISHDLRAPLRSIDSLVQIIAEDYGEKLGEDARNILNVVREGCGRLDQLIAGLLDFLQSARQPLDPMSIDMSAVARAALSDVLTTHPGPRPSVEIAPLPPATCDVALMRQVWCNLIDNALKFSARSAFPTVRISGHAEAGEIRYRIQDNGVGFDMQTAHRLFGIFQRLHKATEYSGTGVGLAIAQRIIARHGGRIWVQATPDAGATFEFSLPIVELTDPPLI